MEAMIDELDRQGIIDRKRVAITGLSYGSELVDYAIAHSDAFSAAIASGGGSRDPFFFYMSGQQWQSTWFKKWGLSGWPLGEPASRWQRLSPQMNADRIHTALLINAADSEYLPGLSLVVSLEQLRKPVELFVYPNELHIKNQPRHRAEIYERNIDWLDFWLNGHRDAAPAKQARYERWEKLRAMRDSSAPRS
jgi:dipeptidyl aminopeptidase/acylaminoacyl peptidase